MPRPRSLIPATLVAAFALGAVACGDGQIGEDEFVARANAQCQEYVTVVRTFTTPRTLAESEAQLNAKLRLERRLRSGLTALDAPDRLSPSMARYLALRGQRAPQLRAQLAAVRANDQAEALRQLTAERRLQEQLAAVAAGAGINTCAGI